MAKIKTYFSKDEQVAPAPAPTFPKTSDELKARVSSLRAEHISITAEILTLERAGVSPPDPTMEPTAKEAGVALLSGSDPETIAPVVEGPSARLAALHRRRNAITEALKLAEDREQIIRAEEFSNRLAAHKPEWDAVCRKVLLALLAVEEALQAQDTVRRKIRPLVILPFNDPAPALGRLKDRNTQLYRAAQLAANQGLITEQEFQAALRQADERR